MSLRGMTLRKALMLGAGVLLLLGASYGALRTRKPPINVPIADVTRGEFTDYTLLHGEVKASKSVVVTAPSNAGDLQIVQLAKNGTLVKQGDVVVVFDASDLQQKLAQAQTTLKQADAEIDRMRAQGKLTTEQDTTDFAKAKFDVERAKLDASKQEILSAIDGEKSKLALADAVQKQAELEQKLKSDMQGVDADVESRKLKRDKSLADVQKNEHSMASMTVKAPVTGMVNLQPNWRAGNFNSAPEWREGDRAWSGAPILELPDLTKIQVEAPLEETDRGRLKVGQAVVIRIDAVPDREFKGIVSVISPLTKPDFTAWPPTRNFNLTIDLVDKDQRLRPGMSASARVVVDTLNAAVLVPAEAIYQRAGRSVAYVLRGSSFEERTVEVGKRGDGKCVITAGLTPGDRVATKDPTIQTKP